MKKSVLLSILFICCLFLLAGCTSELAEYAKEADEVVGDFLSGEISASAAATRLGRIHALVNALDYEDTNEKMRTVQLSMVLTSLEYDASIAALREKYGAFIDMEKQTDIIPKLKEDREELRAFF